MEDHLNMERAVEELGRERAAKEEAVKEKESIRTKLHSAVRKGKLIEAERASLAKQLQALLDAQKQQLQVHL